MCKLLQFLSPLTVHKQRDINKLLLCFFFVIFILALAPLPSSKEYLKDVITAHCRNGFRHSTVKFLTHTPTQETITDTFPLHRDFYQ